MKTKIQLCALRIRTAFILLGLIGCFMSCKSKNEPEQPSQISLKEKAEEVATYLTDNYNVGDSVFFITETGETEGFIVKQNYFMEMIEIVEPEVGEEAKERSTGYNLSTVMESAKNTFWIEIFVTEPQKGSVRVEGSIAINHEFELETNIITKMEGDSITILYPSFDKSCTLRKNAGISHVYNKSFSWDLIQ